MFVFDHFTEHNMLLNLLRDFPLKLDFKDFIHPMSKEKIKSTVYDISAFVKVDHAPLMNDYTVYIRNDKVWWHMCN